MSLGIRKMHLAQLKCLGQLIFFRTESWLSSGNAGNVVIGSDGTEEGKVRIRGSLFAVPEQPFELIDGIHSDSLHEDSAQEIRSTPFLLVGLGYGFPGSLAFWPLKERSGDLIKIRE